jgi:DsbC/DsbD-like thiol-disulfide interchange protein
MNTCAHFVKSAVSGLVLVGMTGLPVDALSLEDAIGVDVLPGWTMPDGRRMAALQLSLGKGWKTYWRAPGDAGIPPSFDWSMQRNVKGLTIGWPTPDVFYQYGMRSIGYTGKVTLPITVEPKRAGGDIRLRGQMNIGLCADVCLPYSLDIDIALTGDETKPSPEIVAALADMPYDAGEADVSSSVCRISPGADGLQIEARLEMPHTGGREATVIEPGVPDVWVSEPQTRRDGATLIAVSDMMHIEGQVFSVNRSRIRITVIGEDYAVDIQGCSGG